MESFNTKDLIESIGSLKEEKNINRPAIQKVLEEVFRTLLKKKYGNADNFDIIVNTEKGDIEILRHREVVEDDMLEDDNLQIPLSEAIKIDPDFEIGEDVYEEIPMESFGRRAAQAARQTLVSKISEIEKDELYKKYKERVGEIITGEVYQVWKKEILVLDDDYNELILPREHLIRNEKYKKGDTIKALVHRVDTTSNNPVIYLSRTDNNFLSKLLEQEVPEIFDGIIAIRRVARIPGERSKVAVESFDERIDPVGACVGMKGSRIHGIVRELRNENIDIINFTNNTSLFIQRCLAPAKINSMDINEENKSVEVYLEPDQVSMAIGRGGANIRLATKLTGYEIEVFRDVEEEEEYDIYLDEFADEIDQWVIDALKNIGLDTAKAVLEHSAPELARRADLEDETVQDVLRILHEEFEDNA
ncbi:MAG: transcription termination factor NusA [Chitinophagales bacterium]|nr:transcription termination/antitermination protein NusA [Bacteroidota bacterium]MCB9043300.1 transcription termination/antitermination protein NusA [Chitinophagales bacterium]